MSTHPAPSSAASPTFALSIGSSESGRTWLRAGGELDLAVAPALSSALRAGILESTWVHLDLAAVTFLDCSCLGVLVTAAHRLRHCGGDLVLTSVNKDAARVIALAGLTKHLLMHSPTPGRLDDRAPRPDAP